MIADRLPQPADLHNPTFSSPIEKTLAAPSEAETSLPDAKVGDTSHSEAPILATVETSYAETRIYATPALQSQTKSTAPAVAVIGPQPGPDEAAARTEVDPRARTANGPIGITGMSTVTDRNGSGGGLRRGVDRAIRCYAIMGGGS